MLDHRCVTVRFLKLCDAADVIFIIYLNLTIILTSACQELLHLLILRNGPTGDVEVSAADFELCLRSLTSRCYYSSILIHNVHVLLR